LQRHDFGRFRVNYSHPSRAWSSRWHSPAQR
jgi:hypothetical protein